MEPLTTSAPSNLVQLRDALFEAGVADLEICTWLKRRMLRGQVSINTGRYAGSVRKVGWSFSDDSQPYPEYAPHWFHVAGEQDDGKGGAREIDYDEDGNLWVAWSRPIGSSWSGPNYSSKKLLRSTVARFWKAAK